MPARPRLPEGRRFVPRPMYANPASVAGLARARAELLTTDPTVTCDLDALAQREQWRREDEAKRNGQPQLPLEPAA